MLKSVQFLQKGWQLCCICCVFASALDCMSVTQGLPLSLKVTHTEYNIIAPFENTFGWSPNKLNCTFGLCTFFPFAVMWCKIQYIKDFKSQTTFTLWNVFSFLLLSQSSPALACHESRCETDKAIFFIASCGVWSIFVIMISQIVNNNLQQTAKHVSARNIYQSVKHSGFINISDTIRDQTVMFPLLLLAHQAYHVSCQQSFWLQPEPKVSKSCVSVFLPSSAITCHVIQLWKALKHF